MFSPLLENFYTILNPLKVGNKHDHKQDRQCAYNLTLRRVGLTTVVLEKQQVLHNLSVCNRSYPACKARGTYRLPSSACVSVPRFPTLSCKRHDCRKEFIEYITCVLVFSANFV